MQKAIYTIVGIDELLSHVQALKGVGARFVQMHAERNVDDGTYRLVYTFINVRAAQEHIVQDGNYAIENLVVEGIDQYQEIPSISSYYPAVFPFENEAHDLFGLAITDMQIDFKGFFYQVSTAEPMSVITPEVKAAREKAMKVRAAAEAKARKAAAEKKAAAPAEENGVDFTHEEEIDFDTFCKVELRVAEVRACENLKESKKLLHLTVFDGERERCILSGIAKWFKPEDLIGKKIGIVCNLAPRPMMKGKYVSEGMIFAADTADGGCSIAFYGDDTPVGSRIH